MKNDERLTNIDALNALITHIVQPLPSDNYESLPDMYGAEPAEGDPSEMWEEWRKLRHAVGEAIDALSAMHDHYYKAVYNIPSPMTMEAIFGAPPRDTNE